MGQLDNVIGRYKRMRNMRDLSLIYTRQYALVGLGSHCVANLLPVIHHLQLPLKYICCTSERKAELISGKYKGVKGTASLQEILDDDTVSGVFVAANPHAHFQLASEVVKAGRRRQVGWPKTCAGGTAKALCARHPDSSRTAEGCQQAALPLPLSDRIVPGGRRFARPVHPSARLCHLPLW